MPPFQGLNSVFPTHRLRGGLNNSAPLQGLCCGLSTINGSYSSRNDFQIDEAKTQPGPAPVHVRCRVAPGSADKVIPVRSPIPCDYPISRSPIFRYLRRIILTFMTLTSRPG